MNLKSLAKADADALTRQAITLHLSWDVRFQALSVDKQNALIGDILKDVNGYVEDVIDNYLSE